MTSTAPHKLRFTIHSSSGEDPDSPVRELLAHGPASRGWASPRFCTYPQEIVLRLESPMKLTQIQILSHEFKIATKIELYAGLAGPKEDPLGGLKRLGYLSFDSNERSNHQARELKSVHLTTPTQLVRLVVHRCWTNKLNVHNQAGIIALNLIGEPLAAGYNQGQELDVQVDSSTAQKIAELTRLKDAAVAREDYEEARRIRDRVDGLKAVGQKIVQLDAKKQAAVAREDYEAAIAIKAEIDQIRRAGDAAAAAATSGRTGGGMRRSGSGRVSGGGGAAGGAGALSGSIPSTPVGTRPVAYDDHPIRPAAGALDSSGQFGGPEESPSYLSNAQPTAYDERPAQGRGKYSASAEGRAAVLEAPSRAAKGGQDNAGAPPGWPGDLPGPEPLTGNSSKDAEPLEELAGEYVARAMFAKNWQLRDAALTYLAGQVEAGQYSDRRDAFRTLVRTVQRGLNDKIANVFLTSLALFSTVTEVLGASGTGGRDMGPTAEMVLPALVEKLGDTNARLREAAREAILNLAGLPEGGLRGATHVLVKPMKNQSAWRPVLGVLQILQDLVPVLGISKTGDGFELGELMEFVNKAFTSANVEVRAAAITVTREVHELVGPAVRKFLAKDLSPKVLEQLDAALDGAGAATSPQATKPPPPAIKANTIANKHANNSKGGKGAAAPPQPPPRAGPKQSSGGSGSSRPVSGTSSAAGGTPRPSSSQAQPAADDPAPFEAELRSREAALGKMHPDVATACTNLAILYNQKGQYLKALPLYERSLKINEKHYGHDHAEVAHTLTDLAVLHLEQGREDVGRPLLERALRIQERALGPDHPDVLAIKDVLMTD